MWLPFDWHFLKFIVCRIMTNAFSRVDNIHIHTLTSEQFAVFGEIRHIAFSIEKRSRTRRMSLNNVYCSVWTKLIIRCKSRAQTMTARENSDRLVLVVEGAAIAYAIAFSRTPWVLHGARTGWTARSLPNSSYCQSLPCQSQLIWSNDHYYINYFKAMSMSIYVSYSVLHLPSAHEYRSLVSLYLSLFVGCVSICFQFNFSF